MTTEKSHSEQQAAAQMESIREMVAALECDYDRLQELRDDRDGWEQPEPEEGEDPPAASWAEENPDDMQELWELEEAAGDCESEDQARERIADDPLSVEVRTGWHTPGEEAKPDEFMILLCTGGPACRIVGDLDDYGQPSSARIEHQDWFTPWTVYWISQEDEEILLTYCRQFYFGD